MENHALEIAEAEIEEQSARRRELEEKRRVLIDRIARADSAKQSVKETIYKKVRGEYDAQLRALEDELEPLADALEKSRAVATMRLEKIDVRVGELRDRMDEISFRHGVGEYDEDAFEKARVPIEEELERLDEERRDLENVLSRLASPRTETEARPAPRREDAPAEAFVPPQPREAPRMEPVMIDIPRSEPVQGETSRIEPVQSDAPPAESSQAAPEAELDTFDTFDTFDFHETDDPQPSRERPVETAPAPAETHADAEHEDRVPPKETSDEANTFVDVSEWVGEFVQEDSTDEAASDKAPHSDAEAHPSDENDNPERRDPSAEDTHDPLSNLADPSDESAAWTDTAASQDESAPYGDGLPILSINSGPGAGKKLPLLPVSMTIGREVDNNIELKDPDVARYHARISYEAGKYVVEDLEGSSGTFVNGKKVTKTALAAGDVIRVGGTELSLDIA